MRQIAGLMRQIGQKARIFAGLVRIGAGGACFLFFVNICAARCWDALPAITKPQHYILITKRRIIYIMYSLGLLGLHIDSVPAARRAVAFDLRACAWEGGAWVSDFW